MVNPLVENGWMSLALR